MENMTLSLTDEIYAELKDGLKTGLDWTHLLAKHSASKGPLYNAIGRFFSDLEPKVRALNEVQGKVDEAGLKLKQLDRRIKEAESNVVPLEDTKRALGEQIETLQAKLAEKKELATNLAEVDELGFNIDTLRQLKSVLGEIGAKHGLKGKEAAGKFFDGLKDYDARLGFEQEIQRLDNITGIKKLEAENWMAKVQKLENQYRNLKGATDAMQALLKGGVQAEQITSWNAIVSMLGGPAQLKDRLGEYKSMSELLAARKSEIEVCDKKVTELGSQIKVLTGQKVAIEGAIKSLSSNGVKRITEVSDKAVTELKSLSNSGVKEITNFSDKAIVELKSLLAELRGETNRLTDLKAEAGKLEKELMYARYLVTGDQAVLKAFPKEVVIAFLDRALSYCKLNQINPMVRVPESFLNRNPSIYSSTQMGLQDLIAWAEVGVAGALQ